MGYWDKPLPPLTAKVVVDDDLMKLRAYILDQRMVSMQYDRKRRIISEYKGKLKSESAYQRFGCEEVSYS